MSRPGPRWEEVTFEIRSSESISKHGESKAEARAAFYSKLYMQLRGACPYLSHGCTAVPHSLCCVMQSRGQVLADARQSKKDMSGRHACSRGLAQVCVGPFMRELSVGKGTALQFSTTGAQGAQAKTPCQGGQLHWHPLFFRVAIKGAAHIHSTARYVARRSKL